MFIRSLVLQRYGIFTDRAVDFGDGSLSLVIGPNEAGKSTALEALSDLLWGIPYTSGQTFLYGRQALALQAAVDLPDEERIDVLRRSTGLSRVDTGAEVRPAWQTAGDSRTRWRESFGLSHTQLREGGQLLCQGGGDLAELVFTARSGRAVRELLADIEHTADSLYKEHRGNKSVAVRQALADYEAAKEQVLAATAGARQVQEAREATEQAKLDVQRAEQRIKAARSALTEAQQRQHAAPDARRLAAVLARAAQLREDGALLDQEELGAYQQVHKQLRAAEEAAAESADELEQLTTDRSGVVVEEAVLADADAIRRLHLEAEARVADGQRAGQLSQEAAALIRRSAALLEDLVGDPGDRTVHELLLELHVPADRAAQLDALADELQEAQQRLSSKEEALQVATRRLREADDRGVELDVDVVAAVRETFGAIQAAGSAVSAQRSAIEAQAEALRRRAEGLRLAGLPVRASVPGTVPSAAVIHETADRLAAARTAMGETERQVQRVLAALEETRAELARAQALELPHPGELPQARGLRDSTIAELITAWQQGRSVAEVGDLPGRVQDAVSRADALGDQLLTHADAAARQAELTKTLGEQETEHAEVHRELADRAGRVQELELQWTSLWPEFGSAVPTPADAPQVRRHLEDARAADEEVAAAATRVRGLQQQVDGQVTALSAALDRAGRPRPGADLDSLVAAAEALLADADAGREERARVDELTRLEHEQRRERDRVAAAHVSVVERWRAQLRAAGVVDDLDVLAWRRRRELVGEARTLQQQADGLSRQAEEALRSNTTFLTAVQALSARHGVLAGEPVSAMGSLSHRLESAVSARQRTEDLDRRIADLQCRVDGEHASRTDALEALERLRDEVGVLDLGELTRAADRSRHALELSDEVERLTDLIRAAAPASELAAVVEEIAGTEPEVLEEVRAAAEQELDLAEGDLREAVTQQAEARQRARDLESSEGAAELHARAQEQLTVVAERVERYLVARIQGEVLRRELEAYERKHASPLLDEAGELLQRLTGGRYVALGITARAGGRGLTIIGADEEQHAPDELSEGTADQVFLALRLAGISSLQEERRAAGAPPLPVVFDDVLMTFDEQRSAAALQVLAELSERWQIIVLSHHAHLAQVAESLALEALTVTQLAAPVTLVAHRSAQEIRVRARSIAVPAPAALVSRPSQPTVQRRAPMVSTAATSVNPGAIREWARAAGYEVGERGRLSAEIIAAYEQAHR